MCRRKEREIEESRWNHNVRIIMPDRQATAAHESLLLLHISRLVFPRTLQTYDNYMYFSNDHVSKHLSDIIDFTKKYSSCSI